MLNSEEWLDALIQQYQDKPSPAAVVDGSLRIVWANQAALEKFPYTSQPDGLSPLLAGLDREAIIQMLKDGMPYHVGAGGLPLRVSELLISPIPYAAEIQGVSGTEPLGILFFPGELPGAGGSQEESEAIIANFSGQIRAPLFVIFSALSTISRRVESCEDPEAHPENEEILELLKTINQNCYDILRSCLNITEVTRYLNGANELELARVDLTAFLGSLCPAASIIVNSIPLKFHYTLPSGPVFSLCDSGKIAFAVLNILSNACRFTAPGGSVDLTASVSGGLFRITVADTGVGMNADIVSHIFDPYFSYNPETGGRAGSGLGLTSVKQIAALHHGTVAVQSEPDHGTAIAFSFELQDNSSLPLTICDSPADYFGDRFSMLYVVMSSTYEAPMP